MMKTSKMTKILLVVVFVTAGIIFDSYALTSPATDTQINQNDLQLKVVTQNS